MLGAIALALLSAACESDRNDAQRTASTNQLQMESTRAVADLAIEKERTKQQIIGSIFQVINTGLSSGQ